MTEEKQELMTRAIVKKILDVFVEYSKTDNDNDLGQYVGAAATAFVRIDIETLRRSLKNPTSENILQDVIGHIEIMKETIVYNLEAVTKGANA